ncbi:hypothetical protein KAI87_07705, partial [Myxococcota bacterium]|nr:hypothetical protein [Myxococcota bacterium]
MHNVVSKMAAAASLFMALSVVGSGCAGDVGDINRVQPGYVKKADLLNKSWYYRRTVVDSPVGMGPNIRYWTGVYTGIGMGDLYQMERIRWDIQENTLIGYTDYEYTPGSEEGEYEGNDTYKGSPIVAFPIKKHFDIIRQYNPSTNEETNVIGENASDRMWHEREFVRVDWDKMSVTGNNMFILPVDILDTNNQVGGNFFVHQDEASNPWHARLTPENDYFDFVVNHFIMPDVYTCYLEYDFAMYDIWDACGSGEIRVRHAFMVVDDEKNAGYEALYYPDTMPILDDNGNEIPDPGTGEVLREEIFGRFGYFRIDRPTYDDQRGVTESGRLDRIIRFDIWENSKNEDGSLIPYADRTPDPIIYYTNWDFPTEMAETAQEVGEEWNDIFRDTVASLQGKSKDDVQDMFIVHPNSCNVDGLTAYLDAHKSVKEKVEVELDGRELLNDEWLRNWCSA